jgi:hypothetical protein
LNGHDGRRDGDAGRSASREELAPAKFIDVFDAEAKKIGGVEHLALGKF